MSRAATDESTRDPNSTIRMLVCVAVWAAAAASSRRFGIWASLGGAAILLGGGVALFSPGAAARMLRPSVRRVVLGAAWGGAMAAATYLLYPLVIAWAPSFAGDTVQLYAAFRDRPFWLSVLALGPVILGEELVWRGLVQTALARRLGSAAGAALAAIVYALAHAPIGSPLLVLAALGCGFVWGALRAQTGSLVPGLVAHLLWDFLVLLWIPLDGR